MSDECLELKNIKYQTMLLNSNSKTKTGSGPTQVANITNIENFLEKEKELNKKKPWSKLGKASKLKRINEYIIKYAKENTLTEALVKQLRVYLLNSLDRKKLSRQKDVIYDMKTNKIKSIPGLVFNKNKFTLKRSDKKTSTLKCLAPKNKTKGRSKSSKKRGKRKHKKTNKIEKDVKE